MCPQEVKKLVLLV